MKDWLREIDVQYPDVASRFPSGAEIKDVISRLSGFDVTIADNGIGGIWQASIVSKLGGDIGEWTVLNVNEYTGDHEEQKLWFEKGWESLIQKILGELVKTTGPLVLIDDASSHPQVIA